MNQRVSFRHLPKRTLGIQVPPRILEALRQRADSEGRSHAFITTEALCRHLDIDPRDFGIEPAKSA